MTELSIAIACVDSMPGCVAESNGGSNGGSNGVSDSPTSSGYCTALCTALACQFAGFRDITIYHCSDATNQSTPQTTSSITLSPNASRILRTLKVLEPLTPFTFEPQFVHQRSYRTGFQLSIAALGAMAVGRYNAPFLHVQSDDLCRELERCAKTRDIKLVSAGQLQGLSQHNKAVTLTLEERNNNSQQVTHDLVLVAGDRGQALRRLSGAESLVSQPTDFVHWQGSVAEAALPSGAFGHVVTQWLGPHHHLSYHFGAQAQRLHISAITHTQPPPSNAEEKAPTADLAAALQQWHPSITALLAATDNFTALPVTTCTSPERLAHGRIAFLGSSCHPITPHVPQQTALGIEDAWVVARMLDQWEDDPTAGLVAYEKYRLPRARRLQTQANLQAQNLCVASPGASWQRNLALTFGSRFLPELAMQKNDWLFGYDAVNGFE